MYPLVVRVSDYRSAIFKGLVKIWIEKFNREILNKVIRPEV
jgi:hypothetical protein